jgi:hypothetical protein
MPGPLADVDTLMAGINADINRLLYMGNDKIIRFIVPDSTQFTKWRTVLVMDQGWDRVADTEKTLGDGSDVFFSVADPEEVMPPVLRMKDLAVEVEDVIYVVSKTDPVASNEARVYMLKCKTRTARNKFFDNSK